VAVVFDTNVLVSAALLAQSKPSLAVRWAARNDRLLASAFVYANVQLVTIQRSVQACRDPSDDKFLEVAVNGGANLLVTGDADLLALDPFEGISILTPADYLARFAN
jgi:uncharacterized protein